MELTTNTTSAQKRNIDEKNPPSSISPKKKKKSTTDSVKDQDSSPVTPMLRSQSAKKGGEIATPTTPALQKIKMYGKSGGTTGSKNSSLFVDAPKMR